MGTRQAGALKMMRNLLLGGAVLMVLGIVLLVVGWPSTEEVSVVGTSEPAMEETGSAVAIIAGSLAGGVGQLMVLVALIAYGVRLGRESTPV